MGLDVLWFRLTLNTMSTESKKLFRNIWKGTPLDITEHCAQAHTPVKRLYLQCLLIELQAMTEMTFALRLWVKLIPFLIITQGLLAPVLVWQKL